MLTIDVISEPTCTMRIEGSKRGFITPGRDLDELTKYDVTLVKPALLFADKVNLISYRIDMQSIVAAEAFQNSQMPMRYTMAYAYLALRNDREELDRLGIPSASLDCREEAADFLADRNKLGNFNKKYESQIYEFQLAVAKILRAQRDALLSDELDLAITRNVLDCSAWQVDMPSPFELSWMETQESFAPKAVASLVQRLATTEGIPLLEPVADLQLKAILGRKRAVKGARSNSSLRAPVAVASAITSMLPGLDKLSIKEVLDLRESLSGYLPAFRGAMADLAEEITKQSGNDLGSLASEIDAYWLRDIAPVLQEISTEVSRARYSRKLLSAFASDKSILAGTASAVILAAGSIYAGAGTLIPAAAAASFPFIRALNDTLHSREDVQKNRLYFLYAIQHHASKKD